MIAIIDYDAGNLKSVEKALHYLGEDAKISQNPQEILGADKVILPGVGAFGDAMEKLHRFGLVEVIEQLVQKNTPLLGICLGLQLLFRGSEEAPNVAGLGVLDGDIVRMPDKEEYKIPHMGWNSLQISPSSKLLKGLDKEPYVYFVHSYYLRADREEDVAATTEYTTHIHAAVECGNVFACQFHPEKSGETGLQILKNFCSL